MKNYVFLIPALCVTSLPAYGQDYPQTQRGAGRAYIGIDVINNAFTYERTDDVVSFESVSGGVKPYVGYKFHPNFAVELGYLFAALDDDTDNDEPSQNVDLGFNGVTMDLVASYPLSPAFDLLGLVGYGYMNSDITITENNITVFHDESSGSEFRIGAGGQLNIIERLGIRGLATYSTLGDNSLMQWNLGLNFTF